MNAIDPENRYYWRKDIQRIDAETLTDRVLSATGQLDDALYGPAIAVKEDDTGQVSVPGDQRRRTVYLQQRRSQPVALLQAYFAGKGPATILPSGVNCILRTNEAFDAPDLQILFGAGALEARPWFPGINDFQDLFYLRPVGAHPESRGRVSLAANDPRVAPRIEPRYFSAPGDLETIRRGFRIVREVASQRALDPFRGVELAPGPSVRTDGEIDEYIRHTATTVQHGSCTCRMGTDDMAVVDPQLRVRGLERLRVVDASVMPEVLSCNIHAAVLAIAERAVDMIRGRIAEG